MKTLFRPLCALAIAAVTFTSCMDSGNNQDNEAEWLQQEKTIDSLLAAEKIEIEDYLAATPAETELGWQEDTVKINLPLLGKTPQRGIWYEVLAEPTEEDDEAYEYKLQNYGNQYDIVHPTVKIKYTAYLLGGTTPVQSDETGSDYTFASPNSQIMNLAWRISFYPYSVKFNGEDVNFGDRAGLTAKGLKKGSKIRVVTPSLFAFGNQNNGDIPANSPLVYEFEVLGIE